MLYNVLLDTFSNCWPPPVLQMLLFRLPDIHCLLVDYLSICDLSSFFFRPLPSELAERNSTKTGHMLGSKCNLKMHVRSLGYPLPYKSGAQNHFFRRLHNLTANLTAYRPIFGTEHVIDNRASALVFMGLLHCLKTTLTLVHKRFKIGLAFYHPL